jgi:UDPglucose 6-dehydrogenase
VKLQSSSITVIGSGYVGLTTGACLASMGHDVVCIDSDNLKIQSLQSGLITIFEPKLESLVLSCVKLGKLQFSTQVLEHLPGAGFVFLCLPTPLDPTGWMDISALEDVCGQIRSSLDPATIVVNKSTGPVNTTRHLQQLLATGNHVVTNPEFLREGSAVDDFLYPDRIIIGCDDPLVGEKVSNIYAKLDCPKLIVDPKSAEAIKYFSNAYLALRVSFINEAAEFCHAVGANVLEVARGIALDRRIGGLFLSPGPGWGGSCFPKDLRALATSSRDIGVTLETVESAIRANRKHISVIVELIRRCIANSQVSVTKIAFLGLAFKANTDDLRESPALAIVSELQLPPDQFILFDPKAQPPNAFADQRAATLTEALEGATLAVVLTEWQEFAQIKPSLVKSLMIGTKIVDTRYVLDRKKFQEHGIEVVTLG